MNKPPSSDGHSDAAARDHAAAPPRRRAISPWTLIGAGFALAALLVLAFGHSTSLVSMLAVTFTSIVLEALPFVMLGSLIGGAIEVFVSRERVSALLPRRRTLAVFVAAGLGIIFPVCECAIIPVTRRLVGKGVPFSVALAYLIAGPIVNPLVAASTAVAYAGDWLIVVTRLSLGFTIAVFIALLVDEIFPGLAALRKNAINDPNQAHCGCGHDHDHSPDKCGHSHEKHIHGRTLFARLTSALEHGADDFLHVSQFLIIGAFIAALSQTLVAREAFVSLAATPAASILLMMLLAVVLNLCSEADAFVAASFRTTLPLSAQMAFLVLGPMLDLKLIAMYLSFVRKRAVVLIACLMCVLVFAMMMTLHYFGWGTA